MADVHTKETRSFNMSRIKGKNTKPEMLVRKFLHANGSRYKLHDKSLPGKPDIVRVAVGTEGQTDLPAGKGRQISTIFILGKEKVKGS